MRPRPITPLSVRAQAFARALARRHALRGRAVEPAAAALVPRLGGGSASWHLHLRRWFVAVQPRLTLALGSAPAAAPVAAGPAFEADAAASAVAAVRAVFRQTERTRERHAVELRAVREARRTVERCAARSRRIDGDDPPAATPSHAGSAALAAAVPTPPPLRLPGPANPGTRAAAERAAPAPALPRAALAALDGAPAHGAARDAPPVPAPAAADVERLADSVLDVIDRRVVAHRERLGRP